MSEIKYFKIEGVPGDYFACESGMGTLSKDACARNYEQAMSPQGLKEGRRVTCRACPIGAMHAGVPGGTESASRFVGSGCCCRCHRPTSRLIRGAICVSCYNREREVLIGANAKGGIPANCRPVFPVTMAVITDGGGRIEMRRFDRVSSMQEARLIVSHAEPKAVWFAGGYCPIIKE